MGKTQVKQQSKTQEYPIPFQDRVIISKFKPETQTASGLFIPETAIQEENKGLVIAVGPLVGRSSSHTGIVLTEQNMETPKPGDMVMFGEYAGVNITFNNKEYIVVREADILAKI